MQGKYINDPEVLKEAAEKAGVADADQVLSDPTVARDQASSSSEVHPRLHKGTSCMRLYLHMARNLGVQLLGHALSSYCQPLQGLVLM